MKIDKMIIMGTITVAGLGLSIYSLIKCHKIKKQLTAVKGAVADGIEIDIPQSFIDEAVDSKVKKEVEKTLNTTKAEVIAAAKLTVRNEAEKAVKSELNHIRKDVKYAIDEKIGEINIDIFKAEVIEKAKQEVADRFDNDLDEVLDEYKDNLRSMTKIFEKIADKVS